MTRSYPCGAQHDDETCEAPIPFTPIWDDGGQDYRSGVLIIDMPWVCPTCGAPTSEQAAKDSLADERAAMRDHSNY